MRNLSTLLLALVLAIPAWAEDPGSQNSVNDGKAAVANAIQDANSMNQQKLSDPVAAQNTAQGNTAQANYEGAGKAHKMGFAQIALGIGLVALGVHTLPSPSGYALIAAGVASQLMGHKSNSAGDYMMDTGNLATGNNGLLTGNPNDGGNGNPNGGGGGGPGGSNYHGGGSDPSGSSVNFAGNDPSGSSIDFNNIPAGPLKDFMDSLKNQGISADDLNAAAKYGTDGSNFGKLSGFDQKAFDSALANAEDALKDPNSKDAKDLLANAGSSANYAEAALKEANDGADSLNGFLPGANGVVGKGGFKNNLAAGAGKNGIDKDADKNGKKGRALASTSGEPSLFERVTSEYNRRSSGMKNTDDFIRDKVREAPKEIRDTLK